MNLALADAMRVYNADIGDIMWLMVEDAYILGLLLFYVLPICYNNGTLRLIMMESVWNCMRIAILFTPIKLLALYTDVKYTTQYRVVSTNVYCLGIDSTDWTRDNDMMEV